MVPFPDRSAIHQPTEKGAPELIGFKHVDSIRNSPHSPLTD